MFKHTECGISLLGFVFFFFFGICMGRRQSKENSILKSYTDIRTGKQHAADLPAILLLSIVVARMTTLSTTRIVTSSWAPAAIRLLISKIDRFKNIVL